MKFKVGQEVVCIKKDMWIRVDGKKMPGPKFNEIYIIIAIDRNVNFYSTIDDALSFSEFPDKRYSSRRFSPVITDSQLAEELLTIPQYETNTRR